MIQIVLHRSLSLVLACSDGMQWERGDTSHGWQDKSADVRRAHVVGWTELSRPCTSRPAGASHRNTNEISARTAIAFCGTLVLPL